VSQTSDSNTVRFYREDVTVDHCDRAFDGYFKIDRYDLRHRRFDGSVSDSLSREVLERGHVVAVLPIDLQRNRIVLVEQFRAGAYAANWQPWLLECIAGIIEDGENNAEVAQRESLEEAGCVVNGLVPIHQFLSSPGASSETVVLYAAATDSAQTGGLHGLIEEGEDIRVHVIDIDEAIELLDAGRIVSAKTIIALQWLARNRLDLATHLSA